MMKIDPRLLIEFAIIAEESSFTKAATRLRMAQPWLSARHRKLEDLIGFTLLQRNTRRVMLTERGAEFLPAARAIASAAAAAEALALQLLRSEKQRLRIGVAPYTKMIKKRSSLIEQFATHYPDVSVELEMGWSLSLIEHLDLAQIDLSFMVGQFDTDRFEGLHLQNLGLALTMSHEHHLAACKSLTVSDLIGERVLVYTRRLNPKLWDDLYAPFINSGVELIESADMAEGPADEINAKNVAAFFDFGADYRLKPKTVSVPLKVDTMVPFSVLRLKQNTSPLIEKFWDLARLEVQNNPQF